MTNKLTWLIGSGMGCDLVVPHHLASRRHCLLTYEDDSFTLTDQGSKHGTYVDARLIAGPTPVHSSSKIALSHAVEIPWPVGQSTDADARITFGTDPANDLVISKTGATPFNALLIVIDKHVLVRLLDAEGDFGIQSSRGHNLRTRAAVLFEDTILVFGEQKISGGALRAYGLAVADALDKRDIHRRIDPAIRAGIAPLEVLTPRERMIRLGMIEATDWDPSIQPSDPISLAAILERIAFRPAPWSTPSAPCPKLTPYQRQQIIEGQYEYLRIGSCLLIDYLGDGGMGKVFKVRELKENRFGALKVLPPEIVTHEDESFSKRFVRESKMLQLLRHPCICDFHHCGEHRGMLYFVMELLVGQDFQKMVHEAAAANYKPEIDSVLEFARQLGEALQYLHGKGIVHRDVKPANVFLTDDGNIKLLDVGIARFYVAHESTGSLAKSITIAGRAVGTPEYMPQEQWANSKDVGPASDIYSLGCTLYCVLAGQPPFEGALPQVAQQHLDDPPPRVSTLRPDIPKWFDDIIQKMLEKSPEHRYASAKDFLEELDRGSRSQQGSWIRGWFRRK